MPYFYKGRGKGGIDCGGTFVLLVNKLVDIDYEFKQYNTNPSPRIIKKEISNYANLVKEPILSGDILLISLSGLPQHIAYYTNNNTIIHTYQNVGKLVEEKFTKYWQDKLDSIYRMRI